MDTKREDSASYESLKSSDGLEDIIGTAVCKVLESYHTYHPNASASMEKNFVVKLLFWLDNMGYDFIKNPKADLIRKCVIHNVTKEQEYYFCYLLVLLGIDVLLLQNKSDIDEKAKKLGIIQEIVIGAFREIELPKYNRNQYSNVISNGSENECENKNFSNALGSNSRNYNVNAVRNSNQQQNCENRQHNNQEPHKIVIKIPRHQGHDAHAAQQKQSMALQPDSGWTAMQPSDGTNSSDQGGILLYGIVHLLHPHKETEVLYSQQLLQQNLPLRIWRCGLPRCNDCNS